MGFLWHCFGTLHRIPLWLNIWHHIGLDMIVCWTSVDCYLVLLRYAHGNCCVYDFYVDYIAFYVTLFVGFLWDLYDVCPGCLMRLPWRLYGSSTHGTVYGTSIGLLCEIDRTSKLFPVSAMVWLLGQYGGCMGVYGIYIGRIWDCR